MAFNIAIFMQSSHVIFNSAFASASCFCGIANSDPPMFSCNFQYLHGEFRKVAKNNAFPFDFVFKPLLLLAKRF